jgi:hypothetical protein
MKKFVLTGLLICLVLPATAQTTRTFSETYTVDATALLRLRNVNGQLNIRTADVSTVSITAVSYFEREQDEQFLDDIQYIATNSGTKLTFYAKFNTWEFAYDCPGGIENMKTTNPDKISLDKFNYDGWTWDGWPWGHGTCYPRGPVTDYEIVMPRTGSLRVTMDEGIMDIDAPTGTVRIDADEGTGIIRNLVNDVIFEADEGSFELEFAQMASLEAEADEAEVKFTFQQAGNFELAVEAEEDTELTFTGRDITVEWDDDEQFVNYSEGTAEHKLEVEGSEASIEFVFID